jgi:hypothetical protein
VKDKPKREMMTMKYAKLIGLPVDALRAACVADAERCSELFEALEMAREDGEDVDAWRVRQVLDAASEALTFYHSGSVADSMAKGCKKARAEYRQLTRFIDKWTTVLAARKAARA